MTVIKIDHATKKQIEYIEQLAIDLNLDRHRRNAHIKSIILREIKAVDELRKFEASKVIDQFKQWKEQQKDMSSYSKEEIE